jgi:hypothetical protein
VAYAQVFRKEDVDKGTVPIANKADLQLLNAVNAGMSIAKPKKVGAPYSTLSGMPYGAHRAACDAQHVAQRRTFIHSDTHCRR